MNNGERFAAWFFGLLGCGIVLMGVISFALLIFHPHNTRGYYTRVANYSDMPVFVVKENLAWWGDRTVFATTAIGEAVTLTDKLNSDMNKGD